LQEAFADWKMLLEVAHLKHGALLRHLNLRRARASASRRPNVPAAFVRTVDIARGSDPARARTVVRTRSQPANGPGQALCQGFPAVARGYARPRHASTAIAGLSRSNRGYRDAAVARTGPQPMPPRLCARRT